MPVKIKKNVVISYFNNANKRKKPGFKSLTYFKYTK